MEALPILIFLLFIAVAVVVAVLSFKKPKTVIEVLDVAYPVDHLVPLVHGALVQSGRTKTFWDGTRILSERSANMWNWGTKMTIQFEALDPQRTRMTITDRLMFGHFDWGSLRKEINEVKGVINAAIGWPAQGTG